MVLSNRFLGLILIIFWGNFSYANTSACERATNTFSSCVDTFEEWRREINSDPTCQAHPNGCAGVWGAQIAQKQQACESRRLVMERVCSNSVSRVEGITNTPSLDVIDKSPSQLSGVVNEPAELPDQGPSAMPGESDTANATSNASDTCSTECGKLVQQNCEGATENASCAFEVLNYHPSCKNVDRNVAANCAIGREKFRISDEPGNVGDPNVPTSSTASLKARREVEIQQDISRFDKDLQDTCRPKVEEASKCCGNGYACIGEALKINEGLASMAGPAIQILATGYATSPIGANGISDMCKKTKNVALFGAALNTALGGLCTYKAEQCKSACGAILEDIKTSQERMCDPSGLGMAGASDSVQLSLSNFVEKCNDKYKELRSLADNRYYGACERADSKTVEHIMSAASAAQAAKFAKFCQDQTIGIDPNNQLNAKTEHQFTPDCNTPAGASNPVCQNPCMRNPNSTECQNFLASNGEPVGVTGSDDPLAANPFGDLPDLGESPDPSAVPNLGNQGLAISPNGGGSSGLPGGGGLPGSGGGASGAAGSDTPNGIIKGQKSGSGYIPSYARSGASGGYSGSARGPASEGGKGFNLKKYLPKDRLAPKRKISSLSGHPQVAPKTSNIFQRISARYREVCLRNRLYECSKLVKAKSRPRGK